ncbi:hypothetical protein DPMN_179212 [Dreissena polymorpha]|uniref:Uncharacterized protein n=2 Tax=Dreissena polymorpha TaxID=45954 RepID=A0A9D4EEQ2_DREPO|nr:hypothetical protein DPMN_179212 [Dreissena polymorpha]
MSCQRKDQCTYIAAARGTPCDEPSLNKWCKEGKCVAKGTSGTPGNQTPIGNGTDSGGVQPQQPQQPEQPEQPQQPEQPSENNYDYWN